MKLALIPPKGLYNYCDSGYMGMALAHLVLGSHYAPENGYIESFEPMHEKKRHIILDNGAAEGNMCTPDELFRAAELVHATEIVLPDELGDPAKTLVMAEEFFDKWKTEGYQYMVVLHAKSFVSGMAMVDLYADLPGVTTIGLPRSLLNIDKSLRINLARTIVDKYKERFKVHLLGTNVTWAKEIYFAAKYTPEIRSVDTSMPFNYAIAARHLSNDSNEQILRPAKYFDLDYKLLEAKDHLRYNIHRVKRWANGLL